MPHPSYEPPVINDPLYSAKPAHVVQLPLEPLPQPREDETPTPRILGCSPRVLGKKNPIHQTSVYGMVFPQFQLPTSWSEVTGDSDPRHLGTRPNLPVVNLSDSQVEAIMRRAKLIHIRATYRPPETDEDALRGMHDILAADVILITDYVVGADPFANLAKALEERDRRAEEPDDPNAPKIVAADEKNAIDQGILASNEEPQRETNGDASEAKRRKKNR